ncbi:Soma ferritin [Papilio xuthus]|uniref:Ferritin n=1 Tax=Papilio xuthus TaxID=66420 RepID=A0A194Q8X6_PAPXU|nr:Soma ferritin [Papilio xuthus]
MHKVLLKSLVLRRQVFKCNIRWKVYYQHKYDPKVEDVINKQIQAEQQAAQDYLAMATMFLHPCMSRPGAGGYFMKMYNEELEHMQKLIEYQLIRGGAIIISGLKAPTMDNKLTLQSAFKKGLSMEKTVTELLENVVAVAEKVDDYQCADFITSVYLAEQMASINELSHHVTNMDRLCGDEHAVYQYDLQLLKSYPNPFKFKMPER